MASTRRRTTPRRPPSRSRAPRARARRQEATAGFAIGIYGQDIIEENALERFGPQGDYDSRAEALRDGLIDRKGEITRKGWDLLNADMVTLERNSLSWLRRKFQQVRDEGHDRYDDLVGTLWFDPQDPAQAYLIELASDTPGRSERIDMVDASYGDLAYVAFNGVSDFGANVLGGAINLFNVEPESAWEEIEATLEREERAHRARRR